MGCFLHITESDMDQIKSGSSGGLSGGNVQDFNRHIRGLAPDINHNLAEMFRNTDVINSQVVLALSSPLLDNRPEVINSIIRDTNEVIKAVDRVPEGLFQRDKMEGVYKRLAGNNNAYKGARYELGVAAEAIRNNSVLQKAGIFFSPGDQIKFGEKYPTNTTQTVATGRGQVFFSFGARRSSVEADILITNKGWMGIEPDTRVAIDTKWRGARPIGLDASRQPTLIEPGRPQRLLEDQLKGVLIAIEQQKVDRFVLVTNTEFTESVHEYVKKLNADLAKHTFPNDPIRLVEHMSID